MRSQNFVDDHFNGKKVGGWTWIDRTPHQVGIVGYGASFFGVTGSRLVTMAARRLQGHACILEKYDNEIRLDRIESNRNIIAAVQLFHNNIRVIIKPHHN